MTGPFGIYFSGGTGNNTEAIYSLIPNTRVAVPGYLPSTHGFAFANHWPAEYITSITLPDQFGDYIVRTLTPSIPTPTIQPSGTDAIGLWPT